MAGIAQLVPRCALAADIGCDHGILGLHLLHSGRCDKVIFSDISQASLNKARKLIAFHRLDHRAAFLVADGAEALPEGLEAVVISGLGGETIADIVARGQNRLEGALLILSPQTEIPQLRKALVEMGFCLERELIIQSRGRFYVAIAARKAVACPAYSPRELYVGSRLESQQGVSMADYFRWRLAVLNMDRQASPVHLDWLKEEVQRASSHQPNHL